MVKEELNSKFLIIAFSKDLYKFHYALSIASSLKAINKSVTVFVSGYACNYIRKNLGEYDNENINEKLEKKKITSIRDIFIYCKELDIKFFFCNTALHFLDISEGDITELIDIKPIGMYSILNSHKENQILFI